MYVGSQTHLFALGETKPVAKDAPPGQEVELKKP
jgi:hypothetical protein